MNDKQIQEFLRGKKIGIVGRIAAGKSTLGINLIALNPTKFHFISEYLNKDLLADYIANPRKHAAAFQCLMAQNALNRQAQADIIVTLQRDATVFIERPMMENVAFALTNFLFGSMDEEDLQFYQKMIKQDFDIPAYQCDMVCVLHINDSVSFDRINSRQRSGEEKYQNKYLNTLNRIHFIMILGWILRSYHNDHILPPCIIPWNPFAPTETILERLYTSAFAPRKQPKQWGDYPIQTCQRDELCNVDTSSYIVIDWDEYRKNWTNDIAKCEETEDLIVGYYTLGSGGDRKIILLCDSTESLRRCCALNAEELKKHY